MDIIRRLAQMLSLKPAREETLRRRVYRLKSPNSSMTLWEQLIVERYDGRSIGEIIQDLYMEELRMGGWAADIGLWRSLFDQSVIDTVMALAERGYIELKPTKEDAKKLDIIEVLLHESETSHFQDTPFREIVTKSPR